MYVCMCVCMYACMYVYYVCDACYVCYVCFVCMHVRIDSSACRPNHTEYTPCKDLFEHMSLGNVGSACDFGTTLKNGSVAPNIPKSNPIFVDKRIGYVM